MIDYLRFAIVKATEGFGAKISGKFAVEKGCSLDRIVTTDCTD